MTRDEAIAIWRTTALSASADEMKKTMRPLVVDRFYDEIAAADVAGFLALGMLKLDEPKSVRTLALDALFKHFGAHDIESIFGLLDEAGFKIVEK